VESNKFPLQIADSQPDEDWEQIRASLAASFYLSRSYASILSAQGLPTIAFRLMNSADSCVGIALGYRSSNWARWPLRGLSKRFHFHTHPAVVGNDTGLQRAFAAMIVARLSATGMSALTFGSEDAPISPQGLAALGMIPKERVEFALPLDLDDQQMLARVKPRKRSLIRQMARDQEVVVREASDLASLKRLIEFQAASHDRRVRRGDPEYSIASQASASTIHRLFIEQGHARLFLALLSGSPVAGVLVHCDGKRSAYYTMAGCSDEGFRASAPTYLVWEMMQQLRRDGYQSLNLGGVSRAEAQDRSGLYQFKSSFGGSEVSCTSWHKSDFGWRSRVEQALGTFR
jgi:hypothetical protein